MEVREFMTNRSKRSIVDQPIIKSQSTINLSAFSLLFCELVEYSQGKSSAPFYAMPSLSYPSPFLMAPQYDPYAAVMAGQSPYMYGASPFMPPQLPSMRRSTSNPTKGHANEKSSKSNEDQTPAESEEQKALEGLPVSFLEPDAPSSFTERISDSFSAIGDGVRNHFRSMTENFSDTVDDLKDAWRFSDNSKKRG